MSASLEERIAACERTNARQRTLIHLQWMGLPIALLLLVCGNAQAQRNVEPKNLTVREIAVVDHAGVVRARLAGDLPPARNRAGRIFKRPSTAGLLIYDEEGLERGGYVTQAPESNALLTLDSKDHQSAWFIAGPSKEQVSSLRLWRPGSSVELRGDEKGARLQVSDASGIVLQQPPPSKGPE